MFIERRKEKNTVKFYLTHSLRKGKQIKKIRRFIGSNLTKKELALKIKESGTELGDKTFYRPFSPRKIISQLSPEELIQKYNLNKQAWVQKGFHAVLHTIFASSELSFKPTKELLGESCDLIIHYTTDNYNNWYWSRKDLERLRKHFLTKLLKKPELLNLILTRWKEKLKKFDQIMSVIDNTDLTKKSDANSLLLYFNFWQRYLEEYALAVCFQESFSLLSEDFLKPHFKKIFEKAGLLHKFGESYQILTSPVKGSFITQEYKERLDLSLSDEEKIKSHVKKYYWISNNYAKAINLDFDFFKNKVKEISNLDKIEEKKRLVQEIKDIKKTKKRLIKELNLDKYSRLLIKTTEIFSFMQDERKKYMMKAVAYQNRFLEHFSRQWEVSKPLLEYSVIHELPEIMQKKFPLSELEERKKHCLLIFTKKGYEIISGERAKQTYELAFKKTDTNISEIKGVIASKGYAQGIVKIIRKIHDFVNFNEGDILVTSMTRPDMVILMGKSTAIVTDEGGITCHAAIVSREMGIPCIIGTKIATKILKDGDLVEVDANKGIVKILKHA